MQSHDPIRLEDFSSRRNAGGFDIGRVSRAEAGRQFRFSLALVITLAIGTMAAVSTMPVGGERQTGPQMAHSNSGPAIVTTVVR